MFAVQGAGPQSPPHPPPLAVEVDPFRLRLDGSRGLDLSNHARARRELAVMVAVMHYVIKFRNSGEPGRQGEADARFTEIAMA